MIRRATGEDIPTLAEMAEEFFSVGNLSGTGLECDRSSIVAFMWDLLEDGRGIFLVAEANGELVGSIAGMVTPWMFNQSQYVLSEAWWFVPGRYRSANPMAAMALLRAFRKEGQTLGAQTLVVSSTERPESERVRKFYQKIGLSLKDANYIGRI